MALLLAFDPKALVEEAKKSNTGGLVIVQNDQVTVSYRPEQRAGVQSVTKIFLSLAAGCLATDGRLPSLEVTLGEVMPELRNDPKGVVTLRQLLTHTSGIADGKDAQGQNLREFNESRDHLAYALARPLAEPPGAKFRYNNVGMLLTGAMLERIAQRPLAEYLRERLFRTMGITSDRWWKNPAGQYVHFAGLQISAADLAKIGQLVLDQGRWGSQQLISPEWMKQSAESAANPALEPSMGLVWFLKASPQSGERPIVIRHTGDGGNALYVFPHQRAVVARVRDMQERPDPFFENLLARMYELVRQGTNGKP